MNLDSNNEVQLFVDKMSTTYQRSAASCPPSLGKKKRFESEELFGLTVMYVGLIPLIILGSSNPLWNSLTIMMCLICIAVGGGQVTLKQIGMKQKATVNI